MTAVRTPIEAVDVTLGYGGRTVSEHLDVGIPEGSFTAIIGPNACGKSTLLRSLARLLEPQDGSIVLDGRAIHDYSSKQVARRLGLLPQASVSPPGITVRDLVARGRYPHRSLLSPWSAADGDAVARALEATGSTHLADRLVDELSGGQRQRVWISLVLAQETPLLLLDEPTTFLDITHQLEVLNLCRRLHATGEYTLAAVLHDLNLAFRYATHLIVMKDGKVVAQGAPQDVVTSDLIQDVYGIGNLCVQDPVTGRPMIVPTDGVDG
ncbi:Fe(3+)-dicitrate ABC transporter ATP-binding protein [Brachybacterium endophyticum]|uniref:Fe(3+)-dicitrate ABC transporter ATP-binding protein n=1 Tax=Brachybacterium endophyticum TaxID=2182385 RepID=A0A2U2RP83_9MICO|nr:ABC transporter ATP-binding protein [Brachybacterium endophyticum]PWH07677.1 Fe(3+)-dicitrate ABC transporter ATP-binding protein [Brachybacterium endophyticum]